MSDQSKIQWTDATWNPVRGCTKVSQGCRNCYAERFAERFRGVPGHPFEQGFDVRLVPEALDLPLRWRKPRRIFVNSMSDLFHENVPEAFIDQVFARMLADVVFEYGPRHTFQVLTKRAERMRRYLAAPPVELLQRWAKAGDGRIIVGDGDEWFSEYVGSQCAAIWDEHGHATTPVEAWSHPERLFPLSNVWLGVSVEDQRAADERIPELLATRAAVRFLSCEPLLGHVDVARWFRPQLPGDPPQWKRSVQTPEGPRPGLDWVIVGGESGPGARPCDVAWIRSLVEQCRVARVPAFVKQLGANIEERNDAGFEGERPTSWPVHIAARDRVEDLDPDQYQGAPVRVRPLDRKGGDPAEWPEDLRVREMPEVRR